MNPTTDRTDSSDNHLDKKMKRRDRVRMINMAERKGAAGDELDMLLYPRQVSNTPENTETANPARDHRPNLRPTASAFSGPFKSNQGGMKRRTRVRVLQAQDTHDTAQSSFYRVVCLTSLFVVAVIAVFVWQVLI